LSAIDSAYESVVIATVCPTQRSTVHYPQCSAVDPAVDPAVNAAHVRAIRATVFTALDSAFFTTHISAVDAAVRTA
jgi:hypothetical protein